MRRVCSKWHTAVPQVGLGLLELINQDFVLGEQPMKKLASGCSSVLQGKEKGDHNQPGTLFPSPETQGLGVQGSFLLRLEPSAIPLHPSLGDYEDRHRARKWKDLEPYLYGRVNLKHSGFECKNPVSGGHRSIRLTGWRSCDKGQTRCRQDRLEIGRASCRERVYVLV